MDTAGRGRNSVDPAWKRPGLACRLLAAVDRDAPMSSRNKTSSTKSQRKGSFKASSGATAKISGQFEGNIAAAGDLHIARGARCRANIRAGRVQVEGNFEGNMAATREMRVSQNGRCKGSFNAGNLHVEGSIEGEAVVHDRMDLSSSAQMKGQIIATRLIVADGASFSGRCTIGKFASGHGEARKAA
jgi:cytoskeletal protein CcmA (bactofilin family)